MTTPVQAIATGDVSELDVVRDALQEEYELLEELGRGGMAIVYRARDKHLEREVAIKVLPFSLAFDQEFVERFTREARTAAQLEHPNIISIYRVGKTGRVIYFTMKLVRGGSLSGLMAERQKLTPPEIRKLLAEVGSALGYAHTRGIVHRDIKPDNIMFDEFGQCVVTDFGIAKAGSGSKLTGTGMSIGTPHYMSPEQARAQSIDGRSDLYSLGILAYQALVGEVPYDGEDSFAIGYKHIMEPIPVPLLDTPDERRLFEVIKRLIQKDPLDRFQTADDLLRALEGQPLAQARRPTQGHNTMAVQPGPPSPSSPLQRPSVAHIPPPPPPPPRPSIAVPPVAPSVDTPRRPVMRRSVAAVQETQPTNWVPWVLAALVLLGVILGGVYLYRRGALGNAERQAAIDSQAIAAAAPNTDSINEAAYDTALAGLDTLGLHPVAPAPVNVSRPADPVAHSADTGFGFLRLRNLPPRSVVLIDSRPVTQPGGSDIRLSAGWHELGITSPGFALFTDSVKIESGRTLAFGPNLASAGPGTAEPGSRQEMRNRLLARMDCDNPAPLNRFGRECYDTPPQPLASTLVPIPAGVDGTPTGVTVLVKVSYQGRTLVVRTRNASNDERFTRAVEAYAGTMRWTPAMRDGQPVDGWTQYAFQPATP
ncbi:MAG TPA: protein kinase [Gemmatimonadales bacterium]|nr:protein kinase [Gemmatimonadales bacterium]